MVPLLHIVGRRAFDNDHHVQPLPAMHRVLHRMKAGAQPGGDHFAAQRLRQIRLRHHGAVGQVASERGLRIGAHKVPHAAPQAICTYQHIAAALVAVSGVDLHCVGVLTHVLHGVVQHQLGCALGLDGRQ